MGVMLKHPVLPNVDLSALRLLDVHAEWLQAWLREIDTEVENGVVSSALCLQGLLSEVALYRQPRRHWAEVAEEYLTAANGFPIAYSEKYGLKLHKFERLWEQVTVHAVYSRWWVESYYQTSASIDFGRLIETFIQPDGWIYNPSVSPTRFRYRMKSEYFMSLALGVEILKAAGFSADHQAQFESTISAHPLTGYLSAEYFRLAALDQLNARRLAPAGLAAMLEMCHAGDGYCDFSLADKRDDYMGTTKRVSRDQALHSPLAALHAAYLASACSPAVHHQVQARLQNFAAHLRQNPLDIPAFKIRDLVDIPFGTGISPLEVLAASAIVTLFG